MVNPGLLRFQPLQNGSLTGTDSVQWCARGEMSATNFAALQQHYALIPEFQSAPRPPSLAGTDARKCNEAAC